MSNKTNGYVPRQEFDEAINELASILDSGLIEPELVVKAREFLGKNKINLICAVLHSRATFDTDQAAVASPRFEPSNLLLRLIAAVRANSLDEFEVISHVLASGVAA